MQLNEYTALQLGEMIKQGELGCEELTRYCLGEIASTARLNTCIEVLEQHAVEQAGKVQQRIDDGEDLSPLAGVPMVLKDNISTKGIHTTCASKMLAGFKPIYDATAYTRLQKAGAILIAKANMDEFAMGSSTETSCFGPTRNPWDTERVPGGSSGGTAAAVAAGQTPFGLGSDTGGSIRQPCAFCGCSGIKPTYGSVSRYGLIAYASSMDQIGPIGRDMLDCAAVLNLIQGRDERDSTSVDTQPLDMEDIRKADIQGITIGIPENYLQEGLDDSVRQSVLAAARMLQGEGAKLVSIHLPVDYAIPSYYIIACAEASSNLSRYDGIKYGYNPGSTSSLEQLYIDARSEGFGMEVKRRIMIGAYVLSSGYYDAYYKKAMQARKLIMGGFEQAFGQCDAILSPTTPTTAYRLGENASDPLKMYLGDIYTVSVNLAGLPAAALPCGFADGMPVGMQLIGRHFDEQTILKLGHRFQLVTDYHSSRPGRVENGKERTHEI